MTGEPDLTQREAEQLRWRQAYARLPEKGVLAAFPTEAACRARLMEARWPDGVLCPQCGARDPKYLQAREMFYCAACLHQFSGTSGSSLHHTRLPILIWFLAGEMLILSHTFGRGIAGHALRRELGLSYQAAFSLKKQLMAEFLSPEPGLIERSICISPAPVLPERIKPDSRNHLHWLIAWSLERRVGPLDMRARNWENYL